MTEAIWGLTRPDLMEILRQADQTGDYVAWNAALEALCLRFWIRTDDYVLRNAEGPLDPEHSAAILRRHRRRWKTLGIG